MSYGGAGDSGATTNRDRAQAPIRWPRPDGGTIVLLVVWAVGVLVATVVPVFIVPPSSRHPSVGRTWFAFLFTVIGCAIMVGTALVQFRRTREGTSLALGFVTAISVFIGGIILVATKLGGGYGQG